MSNQTHQEKAFKKKTRRQWLLYYDNKMSRLIYERDWSKTPLGDIESWPENLWRAVSTMLANSFPTIINWGNDYRQFYNDTLIPTAGFNHPSMLGMPSQETWSEIWDTLLLPTFTQVQESGKPVYIPVQFFPTTRNGFLEESYTTATFSPLFDEYGKVEGVQCTLSEMTSSIIGERRLRTLRDLSMKTSQADSLQDVFRLATEVLEQDSIDIPFSLIYLLDANESKVHLVSSTGIQPEDKISPLVINLSGEDTNNAKWPLKKTMELGPQEVEDLESCFGKLPGGPWPESPHTALILPIAPQVQGRPLGFIIAGISPRLTLDEKYREFLFLMVSQIASAIANAQASDQERKRVQVLAELDRSKTTFFSNVSHEFRTPLTLILGLLEEALAEVEIAEPQLQRERLQTISRNALRLLKLVNQLLDFSAIEVNRMQAAYQPTDLALLTIDLASMYRAAIEKGGLTLIVDCQPIHTPVYVDRDMWEKIVLNLISNAFKHTFEGQIRVTLQQRDTNIVLSIKDSGVGIAPEQLAHLFERFHRIPQARSRTHEGSGIGLALVSELVKLHGGSIAVDSTVNQGTTFSVSIPAGKAHLPAECIQEETDLKASSRKAQPFIEEALGWLPQAKEANDNINNKVETAWYKNTEGEKVRVLLAEDNVDMRNYIARILAYYVEVESVSDGYAALVAARRYPPDLILSDIMMPKMDGLQLLAALRNDPALRTIPVVLLSARAGEEARIEGLQLGADDYLVKPFDKRELLARVKVNLNLELHRITKEAEEARLLSEARFRRLVHSNIIGIFSGQLQDGKIIEANDYVLEMLGYSHSELEAGELNWRQLTPPEYTQLDESKVIESLEKGYLHPFEKQYFHKNGHRVDVLLGAAIMEDTIADFICYVLNISKQKQAEKEIVDYVKRLQQSNYELEHFALIASHDLQEPLRKIMLFSDHLQLTEKQFLSIEGLDDLERIQRATSRMQRLLNDLLDLSRITRKGKPFCKVELNAVTNEVIAELSYSYPDVRTRVQFSGMMVIDADPGQIHQMLFQLLDNALKFHLPDKPSFVDVRIELSEAKECRIMVADNGIGINQEQFSCIFDSFVRLQSQKDYPGTGIGLALVKRIVERHKGTVTVDSIPGKGSIFTILLPIEQP